MSILTGLMFLAVQQSRFQPVSPMPSLPPILMDSFLNAYQGPTKQVCKKYGLEGRVLWIDATANVERYNTEEKIIALVARIRESGFNTIVFDVKPLSSEMVYPSKFAPKLLEWKGKQLPADFDPLLPMTREAKKNALNIYVSMNAFCDGHRLVNRGPGFERPDEQSVLYEPSPILKVGEETLDVATKPEEGKVTMSIEPLKLAEGQVGYAIPCNKRGVMLAAEATLPKGGFYVQTVGTLSEKLKSLHVADTAFVIDSKPNFVRIGLAQDKQYPLMTSPTNPSVRRRLFDLAREVITNYDIDGLIYDDRLRYSGLNGDFAETTRTMFEQSVGAKLNWPDDVFKYTYTFGNGLTKGVRPGKYYDRWMTWRANILKYFVKDVRTMIKTIKPKASMGVYAGSWYGDYQQYGNNWAAPSLEAGFWFMTPEYRESGMAPVLDFLVTGCYYPTATIYDAMSEAKGIGNTVEASGNLSYRGVHDQTFVYAGLSLADFKENPEGLTRAIQASVATTNGVMVFDLSHDIEPMWPVFAKAFAQSRRAPHSSEGYLTEARRLRVAMTRKGIKEPPLVIAAGSAGIGF